MRPGRETGKVVTVPTNTVSETIGAPGVMAEEKANQEKRLFIKKQRSKPLMPPVDRRPHPIYRNPQLKEVYERERRRRVFPTSKEKETGINCDRTENVDAELTHTGLRKTRC